ncbi:MAG TPA: S9 family peptidase [Vicinamibacterales bacterium]|nr:S9 family peptidase [Vicinamibacterales bacterium]
MIRPPTASEFQMYRDRVVRILAAPLVAALLAPEMLAQTDVAARPPVAMKTPHVTTVHGDTLKDDYFWLREKSNPKVISYLEAENAYTEEMMKPTKGLQDTLYNEMLGRIKQTDLSVPTRIGEYYYYSRTEEGKQYPSRCRRKGSMTGAEEILLDLNTLAEGHSYLGLGEFVVSDDGNWLAYTTDTTGYRQYTLHVKDLRSGQASSEKIERTGSTVWATDNKTLFYTTEDAVSKRSDKFWRHVVGTDRNDLLYEEKDDLFDVDTGRSRDKKMIFLTAYAKTSREVRYLPAANPAAELKVVLARQPGHEYDVDHYNGLFYITTNKDAKNFRVVTAPIDAPIEKNWKPFIPHKPGLKIDALNFFANHVVVSEREGGLPYLRVIDMKTQQSHRVATTEPDYAMSMGDNPEFDTPTIRYTYQSMVTPSSVFEYDMNTHARTLLKQQEVLGGYDAAAYEARRVWAVARDGTKVPVSIVSKKGLKLDGKAPLLLYAYGSYGASMAPTFSSNRLSLLDRGAVYALAYIRGGGELGEEWREQGRMMQKLNTFYDFIDCADYLITNKYTSSDRLVIQGGSAGGLLVGAVVNMRPDLFKAVVAQVPFVDVINTMLDASLPLTTSEWIEWGNPNTKADFDYMMKYSPYDNVKAQNYPAMLVQVSLNDSQVPYWEGTKFVAKLRALKTDANPLLLKANMGAGHGGASGRYDALHETAFTYSFMLWQWGLIPRATGTLDPH